MTRLQDIPKNKLIRVEGIVDRYLTHHGAELVAHFVCYNNGTGRNLYSFDEHTLGSLSHKDVDEVWINDEKYQGRLINRITQYLHKNKGVTLSEEHKARLSELIANNTFGATEEIYFDVVHYIRWRPGAFAERYNSCWWGSYKSGKHLFVNEMKRKEAAAIRLFRPATEAEMLNYHVRKWYKSYVGIGRCFALVNNPIGVDIIFNGYGIELKDWKSFLISAMGYTHSKVLNHTFYLHDEIFVNGNNGIALYDDPSIEINDYEEPEFGEYSPQICKECGSKYRSVRCNTCYWRKHQRLFSGHVVPKEEAMLVTYRDWYRNDEQQIYVSQDEIKEGVYRQCAYCTAYLSTSYAHRNRTCCRLHQNLEPAQQNRSMNTPTW